MSGVKLEERKPRQMEILQRSSQRSVQFESDLVFHAQAYLKMTILNNLHPKFDASHAKWESVSLLWTHPARGSYPYDSWKASRGLKQLQSEWIDGVVHDVEQNLAGK